jgi:peptide/nickel transport system substrate-binding protein
MGRSRRRSLVSLSSALALVSVFGVFGAGAAEASPEQGGSAVFLTFAESPTLDPALGRNSAGGGQVPLVPIFDLLAEITIDGEIVPRLAESVETEDALVWTITLREELMFSDGTPLDADAVIAHWDRLADPETGSPSFSEVATMESYEAVDARTIEVTLVERNGQWARYLMAGLGMIPSPTAVAELGDGFASAPVGAGPFTVQEFVRDDHLTLVRNPNYWDAPRPYLDDVTFRPILVPQQRKDTFDAGEGDFSFEVIWSSQMVDWVNQGVEVLLPPISGGQGNVFNVTAPPLDDIRVRRALALATDIEDLNDKVNNGGAPVVDTLFVEESPFYEPTLTAPAHNPEEAQALLDEYIAENGGPVELDIIVTETARLLVETLQQQWTGLDGLEVTVTVLDTAEYQRRLLAKEYSVGGSAVFGVDPEPNMYDFLHSESANNRGGFVSPAIDEALQAGRVALDLEERREAYLRFQEAFWEELPFILTFRLANATAVADRVEGFRIIDAGLPDLTAATVN